MFFENNALTGFIDFYFACTDALAYDLAICINAWCFESDGTFMPARGRAFLRAYQSGRKLTEDGARGPCRSWPAVRRLRFLLTRLYDWINHPPGAMVRKKDPLEYRRKLSFHQKVQNVGDYGL